MKNIVTVGGGTGSYTVLSGLKYVPNVSLSALVSMADDGGSTGVLRDELGVLPPGDVRQCLVALSEHSDIVRKLMNYRFENGGLSGHNFGNIFLAALEKVTGDFGRGVEVASGILKVRGSVIPVTKNKAQLSILLRDGTLIEGETKIDHTDIQKSPIEKIFYKGDVRLNENAKRAIIGSDYIILGPGDYYTSIIPNIIVNGFQQALIKSKAKIILPINLTNKQGHTIHWKASDYVRLIEKYLGKPVDYILINNEVPSKGQVKRYKLQEGDGVLVTDDLDDKRVIRASLLSRLFIKKSKEDELQNIRSFIRHDSKKLADCIAKIIEN
ncbi:MAG TPA: gluconeogenesis factor YvcK family protein [Candidatus Paceibacterota bacterium]|nr:gluconeogenesis factor YvcK family protein [Candidatus Paceibacterota bacterium]